MKDKLKLTVEVEKIGKNGYEITRFQPAPTTRKKKEELAVITGAMKIGSRKVSEWTGINHADISKIRRIYNK